MADNVSHELREVARSAKDLVAEQKKSREEARKARESFREEVRSFSAGALSRGVGALSTPGAGGTDFAVGVARGIRDGLPGVLSTLGAAGGPLGMALGRAAGEALGVAFDQKIEPMLRAREAGIGSVKRQLAPLEANGVRFSEDQIARLIASYIGHEQRKVQAEERIQRIGDRFDPLANRAGR